MKQKAIVMGMLVLMLTGCATQQERAEQRARMRQTVAEAIASRHLHVDIRSMNTMRFGSRIVTPDFFLELRGDTLRSYLPYLGQAHSTTAFSPPIGLNFEERLLQYAESRIKSDRTRLEMDVKTQEDTYHYSVDVYDSGEVLIHVKSLNRDPISFDGSIDAF